GGPLHTADQVEKCRLAGAVRPDDRVDEAAVDGGADRAYRREAAEALGQRADLEHGHSPARAGSGACEAFGRTGASAAAACAACDDRRACQPCQVPTMPYGRKMTSSTRIGPKTTK